MLTGKLISLQKRSAFHHEINVIKIIVVMAAALCIFYSSDLYEYFVEFVLDFLGVKFG